MNENPRDWYKPPNKAWYDNAAGMLLILVVMAGFIGGVLWCVGYMIGLGLCSAGMC